MKLPLNPSFSRSPAWLLGLPGLTLAALFGTLHAADVKVEIYSPAKTYPNAGTQVGHSEAIAAGQAGGARYRVGVFSNAWYISGGTGPTFYPSSSGWVQRGATVLVNDPSDAMGRTEPAPPWRAEGSYVGASVVSLGSVCYRAKWWAGSAMPATSEGNMWESINCPTGSEAPNPLAGGSPATPPASESAPLSPVVAPVADGTGRGSTTADSPATADPAPGSNIPAWDEKGVYLAGSVVQKGGVCYKSNWWSQGGLPPDSKKVNPWDTPWQALSACPQQALASTPVSDSSGAASAADKPAPVVNPQPKDDQAAKGATNEAARRTDQNNTPVVPPVIPAGEEKVSKKVAAPAAKTLPATGYAFLRKVTKDDWDWLFPMRSGKYVDPNKGGSTRNLPPVAAEDGSKDIFTLDAFVSAVLEYNNWAALNGYKQFLNEGTAKQQAEEFLVFWAKSSRETSGSWNNAPTPWITKQSIAGEDITAWKGGLYWVEEVGYTTDSATGKSTAINYVDAGSTAFPPSPGRSYYGRGIIQLSWNYNYGAFSAWMHDNGLFPSVISRRNILLDFPNLVADKSELAILSGIWFWMTPQGAKPSSHDVLYGDVTNVSATTQDMGLPQTNTGYVPKVASGATNDAEVFAYRLGTVINIVNGGLECNRAAKWHPGPMQRVSYYNAYAAYFNAKYAVQAARVAEATNVWDKSATDASAVNLQSASCYNQKSYYGW
jgi:chitodextrinase